MQKKIIIIGGAFVAIVVFIIMLLLETVFKTSPPSQPPNPTLVPTRTPDSIQISGVPIHNILQTGTQINDNGDTVFVDTPNYEIIYLPEFNQFIITILSTPFETVRLQAEEEFLLKTGTSRTDACKLDVSVGTTYEVDPTKADRNYGLSFCE